VAAARVGLPETGAGFWLSYRHRSAAGLLKNELADNHQQRRGRPQRNGCDRQHKYVLFAATQKLVGL